MNTSALYDVAIIGGGLAGLSLSIQLAKKGFAVVLIEKEKYPYHKVCGEYISLESWGFLEGLGLPLSDMELPVIKQLLLTAPNGNSFTTNLPLGGFGISRYTIDYLLYQLAVNAGVTVLEETKAENCDWNEDVFSIKLSSKQQNSPGQVNAAVCCGSFGKRSNLDVKWKRPFIQKKDPQINNFVAVKYHVKTDWPKGVIGLHNFKDGYCGISEIEENKYCLCYLTTAENLKKNNASIPEMESKLLCKNPHLKELFTNSLFLKDFPITISQISFSKKEQVQNGILMLGDAAGMITPLCGNGMSMALHSSQIAAVLISSYLNKKINRAQLEANYSSQWKALFASRLYTGRTLQRFFGSVVLSNFLVSSCNIFPSLANGIIKKTHGKPF